MRVVYLMADRSEACCVFTLRRRCCVFEPGSYICSGMRRLRQHLLKPPLTSGPSPVAFGEKTDVNLNNLPSAPQRRTEAHRRPERSLSDGCPDFK